MPIKLNSTGGGSVTIDVPNMSTANTLTLPAITGNVITSSDSNTVTQTMINRAGFYGGFGPAFSVWRSTSNQSVTTSTWSKINFNAEEFDTANCFDSTTNYRFTPNVAGYYQFTVSAGCTVSSTVSGIGLFKNGAPFKYLTISYISTSPNNVQNGSVLCYLNGSSDYVEGYFYSNGTSPTVYADQSQTYFTGFLARPA